MTASIELAHTRAAFIGLGLMGGSLAMGLRGKCEALLAYDTDPNALALARAHAVVDFASDHLEEVLKPSNLIVLAAPVKTNIDFLRRLAQIKPDPAVVIDLSSTKREIVLEMDKLPDRFDPIGGHPMCGKESLGLMNADPRIFHQAVFALVPLKRTSPQTKKLALEIIRAIEARPLWLDSQVHDRWAAATSHVPYLVASALSLATPVEVQPLIGSGFRSTSRVAGTHPSMMMDVLETNREPILHALMEVQQQLETLKQFLEEQNWSALGNTLNHSVEQRARLVQPVPAGEVQ